MNETPNLGLRKPELQEQFKLDDWNFNIDTLDDFAGDVEAALDGKANAATTYTKTETDSAIAGAIGDLDVSSKGGTGKYISQISEADGKISATVTTASTTPTSGSSVCITSGAVHAALQSKQDNLTFDSTPTASSNNPVKSDGIKTYVDTAVAAKASVSDIYGLGTAIESGTDLNNLTTAGVYTCQTVTVANTLANAPISGSAFRLEVKYLNNSTRLRQECYILSDTATYYARTYTSTGWKPWYMFTGTPVA